MNKFVLTIALGLVAVSCVNAGAIGGGKKGGLFGGNNDYSQYLGGILGGHRSHDDDYGFGEDHGGQHDGFGFGGGDGGHGQGFGMGGGHGRQHDGFGFGGGDGGHGQGFGMGGGRGGQHDGFGFGGGDGGHGQGFGMGGGRGGQHDGFGFGGGDGGHGQGFGMGGGRGGQHDGFGFGGGDGGHGQGFGMGGGRGGFDPVEGSIFAQDRQKAGDRAAISAADRLSNKFSGKDAERERAGVAAEKQNGARVGAKNKFAEEDYVDAKSQNQVQFSNDISKKKNFQFSLVDQSAHDESTKFAADNKAALKKGSRAAAEDKFAAEKVDGERFKAAADSEKKSAFDKDLKIENTHDEKHEALREEDRKAGQEFIGNL